MSNANAEVFAGLRRTAKNVTAFTATQAIPGTRPSCSCGSLLRCPVHAPLKTVIVDYMDRIPR